VDPNVLIPTCSCSSNHLLSPSSCIGTEHLRHQFIHLFDNISEGDIKGFVFQHNSEFICAAVDLFD